MDSTKTFLSKYDTPFLRLQCKRMDTALKNIDKYMEGIQKTVPEEEWNLLVEELAPQEYTASRKNTKNISMVQYARNYILENPSCFDSSIVEETRNNIRRLGKTNDIDTKNDKTSNSDVRKQRKTNDIDSEKEETDTDDSDKEETDTDDSEEETFPQKSLYI